MLLFQCSLAWHSASTRTLYLHFTRKAITRDSIYMLIWDEDVWFAFRWSKFYFVVHWCIIKWPAFPFSGPVMCHQVVYVALSSGPCLFIMWSAGVPSGCPRCCIRWSAMRHQVVRNASSGGPRCVVRWSAVRRQFGLKFYRIYTRKDWGCIVLPWYNLRWWWTTSL